MRPAFTLVHGTWAPHAPWAQKTSRLVLGLRERFGDATPIDALNWGGWNRVSTRSKGAELLRRHLRDAPLEDDQRRFVIAHSHGGNVALYALRDPVAAARTAGVATLATPFLVAQRRHYAKGLSAARFTLLAAAALLLAVLVSGLADRLPARVPGWASGLVVLGLYGLMLMGTWRLAKAWDGFADRVVDAMAFGPIARQRLLVMRSPGDEASIVLLSARVLLSIGMVLVRLLAGVSAALQRMLRRSRDRPMYGWAVGGGIVGAWVLLIVVTAQWVPLNESAVAWLWLLPLVVAGWLVIPIAMNAFGDGDPDPPMLTWHWLLGAALLVAVIAPSLLLVLYGWQLAVANLEVDVSAEATPPGDWRVVTLAGAHAFGDDGAATLTHSALYDDERAIERIGDWVQSILDDEAAWGAVSRPLTGMR
jgi:hypothetical protein